MPLETRTRPAARRHCPWPRLGVAVIALQLLAVAPEPAGAGSLDPLALKRHVLDGEFARADAHLAQLEDHHAAGDATDTPLHAAYEIFNASDPELESRLGEWIEQAPDSDRPYLARGQHYLALAWLTRGARYASDTSEQQMSGLRNYMRKAAHDFGAALDRRPDLPMAYSGLIKVAQAFGDVDSARNLAARGLELEPASFHVRWNLLYALQPKWGGSIDAMRAVVNRAERLIARNADLAVLHGFLPYVVGDGLERAGRPEEAVEQFDRALRFGETALFLAGRADAYEDFEQFDKALADLQRAVEIAPHSVSRWTDLGALRRQRGEPGQALAAYDRALALSPLDPGALVGRGRALADLHRYKEAVEHFERATVYRDHDASLHYRIAWTQRNKLYRSAKRMESALGHLRRAHELDPDDSGYLWALIQAENEARDCAIVDHMEAFLELCRDNDGCDQARRTHVTRKLESFRRDDTCS